MKLIRGLYWPNQQKESWIYSLPEVGGTLAYQRNMLNAAVAACSRHRIAVDGGAHVGLWTLPLQRIFKRVVAFEPQSDNADCLEANCAGFGNIQIHRRALSDTLGKGVLEGHPRKTVSWSLASVVPAFESHPVETIPLDQCALGKLDLLKLDVEGYELKALMGAERTIKEHRPVIIIEEKHDAEKRASALLEQWGMRLTLTAKHDRLYTW
jgi:FkbM family methyltransferase